MAGESTKYLNCDGGTYATAPDQADFDIAAATDWELRVDLSLDDVTPATTQTIMARWGGSTATRQFRMYAATTTGNWQIPFYNTALGLVNELTSPPWSDATRIQLRITVDMDDGAGNHQLVYYKKTGAAIEDLDTHTGWTSHATDDHAHGGNTSLNTSDVAMGVGARQDGVNHISGKLYRAQWWSGIGGSGGTLIADFNADDFNHGDGANDTAVDSQGNTWTIAATSTGTIVDPNASDGPQNMMLLGVG